MGILNAGPVRLLGITHHTLDHRQFEIESCALQDSGGNYDLMVFEICRVLPQRQKRFALGVGFPKTSIPLNDNVVEVLLQSGLAQIRRQLDRGCEETDRVFEPFNYGLTLQPTTRGN